MILMQGGWLTGKIMVDFKILIILYRLTNEILVALTEIQYYYSIIVFHWLFLHKVYTVWRETLAP